MTDVVNYRVIEGCYADLESIHDEFCEDYLWSNVLSNVEIRAKYGLTVGEFNELCNMVKKEFGFSRRPVNHKGAKYYYKMKYGYSIQKTINCIVVYFGFVPSESIARKVVELCKKVEWDVDVCKDIVRNYKVYVN